MQAIENKHGQSLRFNPVTSQWMRYVAIDQKSFILRVGLNNKLEQQEIVIQRLNYLPTFIALFFVTSIGVFFFVTSLNNRLKIRYQKLKPRVQAKTSELLLLQEFGKFPQILLYHDAGRISVIRSSRNLAEIKILWGVEEWFEFGHYPLDACWDLRKGYVHPQGPYDKLIRCNHDVNEQYNTICIPLVAQGETLGIMHIRRDNICDEFDDNDRQMATSLAEPVSLAIANLQLRDNLRNQAKENGRDRVELSDQCIVHAVVSNNC
ncbi:MAG: GAF domain-containing protein [Gammaproteobacteria bacterium]|nr:GAF domain-containing protein [Gammaproteobacteria bacterium]